MKYYIAKVVSGAFPARVERVIEALKTEGFGFLTEIDVSDDEEKTRYRFPGISNTCRVQSAASASGADCRRQDRNNAPVQRDVQNVGDGRIEVAAIDAAISMEHVGNPVLKTIADSVTGKLRRASPQSDNAGELFA